MLPHAFREASARLPQNMWGDFAAFVYCSTVAPPTARMPNANVPDQNLSHIYIYIYLFGYPVGSEISAYQSSVTIVYTRF